MRYTSRVYYTLIAVFDQRGLVVTHEVISLVPTPITPAQAVDPPRPSGRKNGIYEPTDFWMGR
jgi:hypothetical protein